MLLMDLRAKHSQYESAFNELQRVLRDVTEPVDRISAANALRQLYAQPTGTNDLSGLLSDMTTGSRILGGGRGQPQAPAPAPTGQSNVITRAELQAVAQRLGITVQAAEAQARARQMRIE